MCILLHISGMQVTEMSRHRHFRSRSSAHSAATLLLPGSAFATSSMSALFVASCRNIATPLNRSQMGFLERSLTFSSF